MLSLAELTAEEQQLVASAELAAQRAYCRYSKYAVGAALQASSGRIYSGCNVENASYGATLCAERAAVCALVAAGERRIHAVCVYARAEPMPMPCGVCRQVISEFCRDATVLVAGPRGVLRRSFKALLPDAFELSPDEDAP
ncbi:MAG: cytidine deaminase [Myxococcales bacterium]|nr:MAG: cytidine deaminase [Myxococcales bacterium]